DPASRFGGGSLFDPTPAGGGNPPARGNPGSSERTPGPFGPGSAMPLPGGERPSPDYTVKASVTALRYCDERSPDFPKMVAEVWFRTPEDAERVGFRPLNG
ncbi:sunset domain-containing protein, partial [Saccharomonospora iraqiensis]